MSIRNALLSSGPRTHRPAAPRSADAEQDASSPVGTALVMLAVYVTMYLAVAGVLHLLDWVQR